MGRAPRQRRGAQRPPGGPVPPVAPDPEPRSRRPPSRPSPRRRLGAPHSPPRPGPLTHRASLLVAIPGSPFSQGPSHRKPRDPHFRSAPGRRLPRRLRRRRRAVLSAGLLVGDLGVRAAWGAIRGGGSRWASGGPPFPRVSQRAAAGTRVGAAPSAADPGRRAEGAGGSGRPAAPRASRPLAAVSWSRSGRRRGGAGSGGRRRASWAGRPRRCRPAGSARRRGSRWSR